MEKFLADYGLTWVGETDPACSSETAALPAEEAAAPPEVCTGSSDPPSSPVPLPDLSSIPLSADGHVSVDWNPPGSPQDKRVDVLVTGFQEDAYVTVAVGA